MICKGKASEFPPACSFAAGSGDTAGGGGPGLCLHKPATI